MKQSGRATEEMAEADELGHFSGSPSDLLMAPKAANQPQMNGMHADGEDPDQDGLDEWDKNGELEPLFRTASAGPQKIRLSSALIPFICD